MARFTSYGTCCLCGKRTSKAGMTRHLESCPADHDLPRGRPARLFRLRVEDAYSPIFWLDLEIKAGATLADLDDFLRGIWLECCGHLSSFDIEGVGYTVPRYGGPFDDFGDRSMDVKLGKVLAPGTRFGHTYDFGTSTELKLRVVSEREDRIGREPLRLLSRNEALEWACMVCEGPATEICTYCMYEREDPFLCDAHAEEHYCGEEALLPVVNSPRMGMCGYTGQILVEHTRHVVPQQPTRSWLASSYRRCCNSRADTRGYGGCQAPPPVADLPLFGPVKRGSLWRPEPSGSFREGYPARMVKGAMKGARSLRGRGSSHDHRDQTGHGRGASPHAGRRLPLRAGEGRAEEDAAGG